MAESEEEIAKRDFLEDLIYSGFSSTGRSLDHGPRRGPRKVRRFAQDSPVMPDVWIHYGLQPYKRQDLLLTPMLDRSPGKLKNPFEVSASSEPSSSTNPFDTTSLLLLIHPLPRG